MKTLLILLATSMGDVTVELYPEQAPASVANFVEYAKADHYDGTVFHRVIDDFMIQGGGFTADLQQKPTRAPIRNEGGNGLRNERGTLAMARTPIPDSATSQFFINTVDNGFLDRAQSRDGVGYAVFGRVVKGMEIVDRISDVPTTTRNGMGDVPVKPVTIVDVKILAEAPAATPAPTKP